MVRPFVVAFLGLGLVACGAARPARGPTPVASNRDRVSCDELMETREPSLYEAILMTRPGFLRPRVSWSQDPALYVDGVAMVDLGALHTIALTDVLEVAFLSGPDATTRYGSGHVGGALLVRTRRGQAPRGDGM